MSGIMENATVNVSAEKAEVKAKFTATKAKENTAFSFGNRAE